MLSLPGEHRLGVRHAATAAATRRAPGGIREDAWLSWAGRRTPVVTPTNRRIVLRGGRRDPVAHIALERLVCVRAVRRRRRSTVDLEVLLHCPRSGATGELTLRLVLAPRRATALVRAIATAHRARCPHRSPPPRRARSRAACRASSGTTPPSTSRSA